MSGKIHPWITAIILGIGVTIVQCNPTVSTESGQVQGITLTTPTGKKVDAFLGIPYAESPVGSKRFLPPEPKKPWKNIIVADKMPPSCYQIIHPTFKVIDWAISKSNMSEDCLFLNIWVPNHKPQAPAAVMFWIHGGAFLLGSSNIELYDGATLAAEKNVIVVSINYRLNAFGFIHIEGTSAAGNMGLFDQVEALKWVNLNIANFGGNPKKVMLFGESVGAESTSLHIMSPKSKGLFQTAVLQSGYPGLMKKFSGNFDKIAFSKWLTGLNCNKENNNDTVDCLRGIEPDVIVDYTTETAPTLFTSVTKDGIFLEKDTDMHSKQRQFHDVDITIGLNSNDGFASAVAKNPNILYTKDDYFPTTSEFRMVIKNAIKDGGDIGQDIINYFYTNWSSPNDPEAIRQKMKEFMTDYNYLCDSYEFSNQLVKAGRKVYFYYFNHITSVSDLPKWTASMHGDEIAFVFGRPLNPKNNYTKEEVSMSKKMMDFWTNVANYGNPNGVVKNDAQRNKEEWPLYSPKNQELIQLNVNMTIRKTVRVKECAFWSQLYPKIVRFAESQSSNQC